VVLGNRVTSEADKELIEKSMPDYEILGFLPEMDEVVASDRKGIRPFDDPEHIPEEVIAVTRKLMALDVSRKR
jgi:CO dehydrogenase maturation factor